MTVIGNPWQVLLDWLARMEPSRREILLASIALLILFAVGTTGYALLEGWSWMDGLFMTFITLTTIGYQEIHPLSDAARLFTLGLGITGIGLLTFVVARSAQLLVASERLQERRVMSQINNLSDHFIICGYGRVGQRLAEDLQAAGRSVVVVDIADEEIADLRDEDILHVQGDAEKEETLERAGIDRAHGLILTLPEDSSNVFVALTARQMNPALFILARTVDHSNEQKLLNAGANKVIAPSDVGADRMAQVVLRPNVDQFMERVLHARSLSLKIDEVKVHQSAPLAGKSLAESNFRQQFDAVVIGMIDAETEDMIFNPTPTARIDAGDVLIVLGDADVIQSLREKVCTA